MVVDESSTALAQQLRLLMSRFQATGTRWDKLSHIIETPFFFDSRNSRMMQIADFVSYAVFRWYESNDTSLLSMLYDQFDREEHKVHGLKCYPLASTRDFTVAGMKLP